MSRIIAPGREEGKPVEHVSAAVLYLPIAVLNVGPQTVGRRMINRHVSEEIEQGIIDGIRADFSLDESITQLYLGPFLGSKEASGFDKAFLGSVVDKIGNEYAGVRVEEKKAKVWLPTDITIAQPR